MGRVQSGFVNGKQVALRQHAERWAKTSPPRMLSSRQRSRLDLLSLRRVVFLGPLDLSGVRPRP